MKLQSIEPSQQDWPEMKRKRLKEDNKKFVDQTQQKSNESKIDSPNQKVLTGKKLCLAFLNYLRSPLT